MTETDQIIARLMEERDAWRFACRSWESAHHLAVEYLTTPSEGIDGGTGEDWEDIFVEREREYDNEKSHAERMTQHAEKIAQRTPLPPVPTVAG